MRTKPVPVVQDDYDDLPPLIDSDDDGEGGTGMTVIDLQEVDSFFNGVEFVAKAFDNNHICAGALPPVVPPQPAVALNKPFRMFLTWEMPDGSFHTEVI